MNKYKCKKCGTEVVVNSAAPKLSMPCDKCGGQQEFAPSSRRVNPEVGKTQVAPPAPVEEAKPNLNLNQLDVKKELAKPEVAKK